MNYSDDKEIRDNTQSDAARDFDAEKATEHSAAARGAVYGEAIAISVKAVAVALSLVIIITSILAVALPLSAMRVFNNLGMTERAFDFGARYISRELDGYGADTDDKGNYKSLAQATVDDGFVEALDVGIGLAYKLAEKYADKGDSASVAYYAEYLERYTRMYSCLKDFGRLTAEKDALRIAGVPTLAMRPYVYSYAHDMRVMNYRARAYLGETDSLLYNSRIIGDTVTTLDGMANTYTGQNPLDVADAARRADLLDDFTDYIAQLGTYLSVEFDKLGVSGSYTEGDMQNLFSNVMTGDEFALFVTRGNGFSTVYERLKNFGDYSRAAYEFPVATFDERLRQLYWLQELSSASTKLWYMSMLLYYNRDMYGAAKTAIVDEYNRYGNGDGTCARYRFVWQEDVDGKPYGRLIAELYAQKFEQYLSMIKAE